MVQFFHADGTRIVMTNTNDHVNESYVVEIDGEVKSQHRIFMEALQAGLKAKQQFPRGDIKVHGANEHLPSAS
jgi:DMSO/TMAO reductase YedYZ molybdopterin-dependent catalytic subunit